MRTRPARHDDLPALYGIFTAAVGDLYQHHGFDPPDVSLETFSRQHAHMLDHDARSFWVAEAGARPVGFGAAIVRGDVWFLSALFVEPAHQASGVGKELLRLAWSAGGAAVHRRLTIVDAFQPVSIALYSRAGLLPVTPILSLGGMAEQSEGSELEPAEPADGDLGALDSAAYGFDRAPDHDFWQHYGRLTLWQRDGEPAAYSYRWPGGRIGPVAGRTADDAGAALAAELGRSAGNRASLVVPGTARVALTVALKAGLRYTDPPGLILSTEPAGPQALVPHGYSLY